MMSPAIQAILNQESHPLHKVWSSFVRRRMDAADQRWSNRYDRWRESERLYRAFRPSDLNDQQRRETPLTEGVEKIVVPYGYAVIQSTLAYFMTVLTQRKPLIPVEGYAPGDTRAAILMEAILDRQMGCMEPRGVLVWYQWLLDTLRYGLGVIKNVWTINEFPDLVRRVTPIMDPQSGQQMGYQDTLSQRDVISYEGNQAYNISPFNFLPDPNVELANFQRGEFCCHRMRRSWTELRQKQAEGLYAGIQWISKQRESSGAENLYGAGSDTARIMGMDEIDTTFIDPYGQPYVDLCEMWAYVDPDELGLAQGGSQTGELPLGMGPDGVSPNEPRSSGTPEMWVFTLANKSRIVRVEPANLPGHRFPFEIIEINYDVHSPANFGMIESFRGPQYIMSWLMNSRLLNVSKTINNEYVIDPSMIDERDFMDPEPGRLLRLREQAQMSGQIQQAVFPLPVQDVTQGHYNDLQVMKQLVQEISAANPMIMGLSNPGRRAATEVQGQMSLSSGRMKMYIEIVVNQGFKPQCRQMSRNTQAFVGEMGLRLKPPYDQIIGAPFVQVNPAMIQGEFDFPFTDAGMPSDRLFEANMWKEMLQMFMQAGAGPMMFGQNPQMLMQMMMAVWGRFLRGMGVKDLQTFGVNLPQLSLAPDELVQQQAQQGNMVPLQNDPGAPQGMAGADGFSLPPASATPGVGSNGMGVG